MSIFNGKMKEDSLDFIRIDEFQVGNHDGTLFFLSHFHTDHFKGIFESNFLKELVQNDTKTLYCSAYTKSLILNHKLCRIPSNKITPLTVNAPCVLFHEGREPVQVTSIPAGHCPGSVMFLFEQGNIRVLYTGDFRYEDPSELSKFKPLLDKTGAVKKIQTLYMDMTFCSTKWLCFPPRKQSLKDLTTLVMEWLNSDPSHEVGIWYISYHGLEPLLMELAKILKSCVWVTDTQSYLNYSCIPELHAMLCRDKSTSRVHLCPVKSRQFCPTCLQNRANTRTIKPCAQSFDQQQLLLSRQVEDKSGIVKIAYSLHCSLEELIRTFKYLSPENVEPCALPSFVNKEQGLQYLKLDIDELKEKFEKEKENQLSNRSDSPKAKRFCPCQDSEDETPGFDLIIKEECDIETITLSSCDEEEKPLSQGDLFGLDSPPF